MKPQVILTAVALAVIQVSQAGEPVAPARLNTLASSGWEFTGALYAPIMGLEGTVGLGPVRSSVDIGFGDILKKLDGGLSGAFEARHDRWSITGDFIWLKLSDSANPIASTYLGFKEEEILASVALGYELYKDDRTSLDVLAGAAFTSVDVELDVSTPLLPIKYRALSGSETWVDPFIGLRVRHQLSTNWSVFARADYGGFGVSSDEYWQALVGLGYRLSESTSVVLAYRIAATDYQSGRFVYDTKMSGPNLGLVIRF